MKGDQIESCKKCLLIKTYEWQKKSSTRCFNKKKIPDVYVKNRCVRGR